MMRPKRLCLYHYPCADGVFAAWGFELAAPGETVFKAHSTHPDKRLAVADLPDADELVLVDYCGPDVAWLSECLARYDHVLLVDHHKTASDMLEALPLANQGKPLANQGKLYVIMNDGFSACNLVRRFLELPLGQERAHLWDYIQDNDLYTHVMPGSKALTLGLKARGIEYDIEKNPALWSQLGALRMGELLSEGFKLFEQQAALMSHYMSMVVMKRLGGLDVPSCVIRANQHGIINDLGHSMAKAFRIGVGAVCIEDEEAGYARVSLRSLSHVNCLPLAAEYGGGGHAQSAGFSMPLRQWRAL